MPAKSKAQQKFFGVVKAVQKGDIPKSKVSKNLAKVAKEMPSTEVDKFAKTKTKFLPNKMKQEEVIREIIRGELSKLNEGYLETKFPMEAKFTKEIGNIIKSKVKSTKLNSSYVFYKMLIEWAIKQLHEHPNYNSTYEDY